MTGRDPRPDGPAPAAGEEDIERRLLWAARMECLAALASGLTHSLSNLLGSTLSARLDASGRWQLAAAAAATPVVLMIDAETADRLDREPASRQRGLEPLAVLRKPFTARELLAAPASGATRRAPR